MKIISSPPEGYFFRIIELTLICFKIIGLASFSFRKTEPPGGSPRHTDQCRHTFLFSKIGLVHNIWLSISILVMGVVAILQFISMNFPNKSCIAQTVDVLRGIIRTLTSCIILLVWAFKQETAASIMNRLLEANRQLSGIRKNKSSKKMSSKFLAIHVIFNAFLWVAFGASYEASLSSFPSWFVVPIFVINWFIIEYSLLLGVLVKEVENLNNSLLDLEELPNSSICTPLVNDYQAVVHTLATHNKLASLQLLHTIRTKLYEVSSDIAEFFSLPILPCIACSFLILVYNIYYLISPVVIPVDGLAPTITDAINISIWICINIYPLILLAATVTETLMEVERTGSIVHKLLTVAKKQEIKLKFSYELLHENLDFTAYGLLTLDFTLIQSIFGATLTYLVIIIQFMRSADTSNNT